MTQRNAVLDMIIELKVVPVVVIDDADDAVPLLTALREAGLPVAEITFRTAAALDALRAVRDAGLTEGPNPVLLGAGTVTTIEHVDTAIAAGAQFIVSPGFSPKIVQHCQDREVVVVPGAVTASEVQACLELGLTTLKFFPAATSGGPEAVRALGGPFHGVRLIPTGGIDLSNIERYLRLPNVIAIGGSWMVPRPAIKAKNFSAIQSLTKETVSAVQALTPKATS
ncbi:MULTISPECIES: bifunctional 4-hydroxy-2-oxoglutarate aldolase/2-dehydro-3-deoxy-phosphogluconate aldolase [unclassified Arthrobacter]|uniref:bifunctional 4-hydroxy-2-oxoglutarate aldolase/2-dehydro-3-deoxy-phosphogluconate aldolase n=1 Tax=unclassified Arthrobacter TaxID=235627 RepID=UPI001E536C56|nr:MULTISPECIES: bifunctional 4-hydroxy-2-oxoglutarate aldolase/2-dehydro-3-deoxy-phosphogluconate aldolase [unclassified Arthrobacter]MCC9146836.1 bifunctional 4-hydroxy-2-oxoglutarate aldolase/2-dehydro-3-deoxy-phosphogluconate aldolase [Arthrobacter sp. zg-Y919]MDK1278067.1 bifunctional 4-hydroxy-2-oxoglutarate aldolase/2-dehydro-3-deoxy-phosphogluconate aldolase [Arthrobacter sp. zg.Y919]WIB03345.1 bifunctional 4-hydroxy-2-oxoglutarate aldolase/2-dehydro-3-deoxy-phosphogluconate aldolase [Ar